MEGNHVEPPVRAGRTEAQRIPLVDFALSGYVLTPIEELDGTFKDMRKAALEVKAIGPSSVMRGFQMCPADLVAQDDTRNVSTTSASTTEAQSTTTDKQNDKHYANSCNENLSWKSGILFPFEVRLHPENGRSVYFTAPVPKGTTLWRGSFGSSAVFTNREQYEAFLRNLTAQQACEAIQWTFPDIVKRRQKDSVDISRKLRAEASEETTADSAGVTEEAVAMVLVLDEGSLFDHTNCDPLGSTEEWCSRALRDIEIGEALCENYNSMPDDSDWFCNFVDDLVVARQSCRTSADVLQLVLSQGSKEISEKGPEINRLCASR
jgi:hypothetical protein